jgi:hypothetical protein
VYRRFRDHGRQAPDGLQDLASWVSADFTRCYQLMACEDPAWSIAGSRPEPTSVRLQPDHQQRTVKSEIDTRASLAYP